MKNEMMLMSAAALMLLTGCEKAEAPAPSDTTMTEVPVESVAPSDSAHRFASWAGNWTGVEGMYVTITPTEPGNYSLAMQSDLDTNGTYVGSDSEHGIAFERGGETLTLTRASGDETGLKYLAGKTECLKVKDGEGYCRD